jgi:hypothetical protein
LLSSRKNFKRLSSNIKAYKVSLQTGIIVTIISNQEYSAKQL